RFAGPGVFSLLPSLHRNGDNAVRTHAWLLALAALLSGLSAHAGRAAEPTAARELLPFGNVRAPILETVRAQAIEWLKSTNKFDQSAFDAIWSQTDRPLLD